jgi:hypothetical protein
VTSKFKHGKRSGLSVSIKFETLLCLPFVFSQLCFFFFLKMLLPAQIARNLLESCNCFVRSRACVLHLVVECITCMRSVRALSLLSASVTAPLQLESDSAKPHARGVRTRCASPCFAARYCCPFFVMLMSAVVSYNKCVGCVASCYLVRRLQEERRLAICVVYAPRWRCCLLGSPRGLAWRAHGVPCTLL